MGVTANNGVWVAQYPYEQRDVPKAAGFWWHGAPCRDTCEACKAGLKLKVWWTPKSECAARLKSQCDQAALDLLSGHIKTVEASKAVDADIEIPCNEGLAYLPYQKGGIAYTMAHQNTLIGDEMGLGKGHPVGTKLLTPVGWADIADIKVGDDVVGSDGKATKVTGVFARGKLPVFSVNFSDDSSVLVDGDHLWNVWEHNDWHRGKPARTIATRDMGKLRDAANNCRWRIPMVNPVVFAEASLPIDPYLLGVLLADGALTQNAVTFCCGDENVPVEVGKVLPPGIMLTRHDYDNRATAWNVVSDSYFNPVNQSLLNLGLKGKRSYERFVPDLYKFSAPAQRLALLQGLMDTDGELRPDGYVGYCSTSLALAEAVQFLVQSFGGTSRINTKNSPKYTHNNELRTGRRAFNVQIALPEGVNPFRAVNGYAGRSKYPPSRLIRSIEPHGEGDVICISVAAKDQLYVTEHCIVTHNTIQALGAINASATVKSVLCVVPASLKLNWNRESLKWLTRTFETFVVDENKDIIPETANFVIVNYDLIRGKRVDDPNGAKATNGKVLKIVQGSLIHAQLMKRDWDVMIVDECHRIKDPKSLQAVAVLGSPGNKKKNELPVRGLKDQAARNIFLTGTPFLNRPVELFPILNALAPQEFDNFFKFAKRYCAAHQTDRGHWDFKGASHLEELQERLRATCFPYEMTVDCEHGPIQIGKIVEDNIDVKVWSRSEDGKVRLRRVIGHHKRKFSAYLVCVHHEHGWFICTPDHKIWTEEAGYTRADSLDSTHHLSVLRLPVRKAISRQANDVEVLQPALCHQGASSSWSCYEENGSSQAYQENWPRSEDLRNLWQGRDQATEQARKGQPVADQKVLFSELFEQMEVNSPGIKSSHACDANEGNGMAHGKAEAGHICTDERSYLVGGSQGEAVGLAQGGLGQKGCRISPPFEQPNFTSAEDARSGIEISDGVDGVRDSVQASFWGLQASRSFSDGGHRSPANEVSDRSGRPVAQRSQATISRSMEGTSTRSSRVVCVEVLKSRDQCGRKGSSREDQAVYCLEVEDDHNFFVGGILVSNCMVRRLKKDVLKELPPKRRQVIMLPADGATKAVAAEAKAWKMHEERLETLRGEADFAHASGDKDAYKTAVDALKAAARIGFEEIAKERRNVAVAKLPMVIAHIEDAFEQGIDKIVLFCWHHDVANAMMSHFGDALRSDRNGVRAMDGDLSASESVSKTDVAMQMQLRAGERNSRGLVEERNIDAMHEMQGAADADNARSSQNSSLSHADASPAKSAKGGRSVRNKAGGHRNPGKVSPPGYFDRVQPQASLPIEPVTGPNRTSQGVRSGERLGDQLASERDQEQCEPGGTGDAVKKSKVPGYPCAVALTGEVSSNKDRQAAVDRFQTDPKVKLFIGSIGAAGVGHTLTASSTVIFAELDWVPANISQAEDRCHRIGQHDQVLVQHLVLDGSLDARMATILVEKQDIADKALDRDTEIEVATPTTSTRRPGQYPVASPTKRVAALQAMQLLAGRCDGARVEDGAGFNKIDTGVGHKLALCAELTDGQVWMATNFARKYQRQLPDPMLIALGIETF